MTGVGDSGSTGVFFVFAPYGQVLDVADYFVFDRGKQVGSQRVDFQFFPSLPERNKYVLHDLFAVFFRIDGSTCKLVKFFPVKVKDVGKSQPITLF
jgi:hypothetical protein